MSTTTDAAVLSLANAGIESNAMAATIGREIGEHPKLQAAIATTQSKLAAIQLLVAPPAPPPVIAPLGIPGNWANPVKNWDFRNSAPLPAEFTPGWWPDADGYSRWVNSNEDNGYYSGNVVPGLDGLELNLTNTPMSVSVDNQNYTFSKTGALISSDPDTNPNGYTFLYGALEAYVYCPPTPDGKVANWPGLWLNARSNQAWYEDDLMEGLGGFFGVHVHTSTDGGPGFTVQNTGPGWHTIAVNWTPALNTYYYDGKPVGTETFDVPAEEQYIVVDNTTWKGSSETVVPATMKVGYIRQWAQPLAA